MCPLIVRPVPVLAAAAAAARSSGPVDVSSNELMGNIGEVKGRDVVIVDELIDTGGTLAALPRRLKKAGAMVSLSQRKCKHSNRLSHQIFATARLWELLTFGRYWRTVRCCNVSTLV